jgi:hypothetical protein
LEEKFAAKNIQVKFSSISEQNRAPTDLFVYFVGLILLKIAKNIARDSVVANNQLAVNSFLLLFLFKEKKMREIFKRTMMTHS